MANRETLALLGARTQMAMAAATSASRIISLENYSDVGLHIGEENEVLHNLPTDTGCKIGEFDDLKKAFDKLAQPFNATLRAPEQKKSQTLSLSNMLDEVRASYETLRSEFYEIDKTAAALEGEAERLREDLELSREQWRHHNTPGHSTIFRKADT
jgi:crescentin